MIAKVSLYKRCPVHCCHCLWIIQEAGDGGCLGVVGGSMDTDSSVVKATQQETT